MNYNSEYCTMINNDPLKIGVVPLPMEWILPGPGWDAAIHRREHPQEPLPGAVTQLITMDGYWVVIG